MILVRISISLIDSIPYRFSHCSFQPHTKQGSDGFSDRAEAEGVWARLWQSSSSTWKYRRWTFLYSINESRLTQEMDLEEFNVRGISPALFLHQVLFGISLMDSRRVQGEWTEPPSTSLFPHFHRSGTWSASASTLCWNDKTKYGVTSRQWNWLMEWFGNQKLILDSRPRPYGLLFVLIQHDAGVGLNNFQISYRHC